LFGKKPFRTRAVLFDLDGTLSRPGALDFSIIKKKIGCPPQNPVLEFIHDISDYLKRQKNLDALDQFEMKAALKSEPNEGAEKIVSYLKSKGLIVGIISRNSRQSILKALENFNHIKEDQIDLIISRDDPVKPKPSGEGIIMAARRFGIKPDEIMMVGDFIFDIEAGKNAGAVTVFLKNKNISEPADCDFSISHLAELKDIIRMGIALPNGKLPNDLLEIFLDHFRIQDPSLLIHPGIGQDIAAADISKEQVIVLKTDPITFATDSIGRYAVLINANDIATSGAFPRWLMTTLLFPPGTTPSQIWHAMCEIEQVCFECGITPCGGHTEITDAVTRPVISGMMVGTVKKHALIEKHCMKPGDRLLITKGISVEGTAIIAREFSGRLKKLGLSDSEIEKCKRFLNHISIVKEAEIASKTAMTSAMHDITEGGLATAITELSIAGGHRLRINMEQIPIFPETRRICKLFQLNPLGLIGSGSLLICCKPQAMAPIMAKIQDADISVACIGKVLEPGRGIDARYRGNAEIWPNFEVDELTRLF
jgi:HAD superfamily hydrolase (TIGR01509 family)